MSFFLILIIVGLPNDCCDGCHAGFYGDDCSSECPNFCHDNECNVTTGKCLSCVKGHYSNNSKDCVPCPKHCTACSSDKFCFACNSGFRGEVCENKCTNCKPYTSCDKNTGYCFENCSEGLSGDLCIIPCDSKCKSCDRHYTGQCISCADDQNGIACKEECFNKCLRNTCNESHEACAKECLSGYTTDKTCNQTCLSHCKDRCKNRCKELVLPDRPSSPTTKAKIGLILGMVFGSIVIVVSITVIIVRKSYVQRSYCRCMSSDITQDQNTTSAKNEDENIELLPQKSQEAIKTIKTMEFPSADKLKILQMQGTFSAIQEKYYDMKITVAGNRVTVEGDRLDIENTFKQINIKMHQVENVRFKHSKSREWLMFYNKDQTVKYVKKKLEQKQLIGIWCINGTDLTVFVFGKGNSETFKNTLLGSVLEISVQVDNSLLSSEWCGEFLIDIRKIFQEKVDIFTQEQQDMVIICTDDVVKQVTKMVSEFLEAITDAIQCEPGVCEFVSKYWTQDDFDDIRKNGVKIKTEANRIRLRGLQENVAKGKEKLNMKLKDMCSKQTVLNRTGIVTSLEVAKHSGTISDIEMDCRCVIKLPQEIDERPSVMLFDFEAIESQLLEEEFQESCSNTCTICFQTTKHNRKTLLIQGDIVDQKADIIVVGAASNLELQSGYDFDSLLKKGGPKLKTDYDRRYPNGIQNGDVAVIDSGNFNCDKIYLTSLPPWKEASRNGGKVLTNFMRECLRLADKYDKNSIAFSIMATWEKLGYPIETAVSIMFGAIVEFDSSYTKTSLTEINIVEDNETIKTCIMYHLKNLARANRTYRTFIEDGTIFTKLHEDTKYRMVKDGCAIGPIQLQVQIGDLLNCTTDAIVLEVGANIDSKEKVQRDGVMKTDSTGIKAKHVIHVQFEESLAGWRSKLVRCLEEAGKKDIKSVALSVVGLGTGTKTFSPDGIGACLFAVVDDYTSQNHKSSVTDVRLVVDDRYARCVPAIIAALQDRTTAVNSQWGIGKIFKSQLVFLEPNNVKESSVTIYSDATSNLDRCIKALIDRIRMEFAEKVVDVDMDVIRSLKDKQINSIIDSDIVVDVKFNKKAGQFTISGPLFNVLAAVACLQNKMQQYTRKENNRKSAKALYDQTRWHWLCDSQEATEEEEVPYDMMTNYIIETGYKEGKQTVELQSKDGKIYVIDFHKLVEYQKCNIYDTVLVMRTNILEKDSFKDLRSDATILFSKSWTPMSKNENVKRVCLEYGEEYQKVEKRFLAEIMDSLYSSKENIRSVQVVKIERIQNKTLYKQYKNMKNVMQQQQSGCKQTERQLWHDTSEERIRWIISNGFNRRYSGIHETLYGQGVYFAADASYSAKTNLAGYKSGADRYMFLAKVLTGTLIKGHPSMRVHPLVDPDHPNVVYDSAVDDVKNPMQFVIFHDKQAYPKYLITYTSQ